MVSIRKNCGNLFSGQFKTNMNFIDVFARNSYVLFSIVPQLLSEVYISYSLLYSG